MHKHNEKKIIRFGTSYGGWCVYAPLELNSESIVYSAGAGEDISFDLHLAHHTNAHLFVIDPTRRAKTHFDEVKRFFERSGDSKFTGKIQRDYVANIRDLEPNFDNVTFVDKGIWSKTTQLKFYKQRDESNVSQSLIDNMFGSKFDIVNVMSVKDLMSMYGHTKIDIFKLDIEGAEIDVLNAMFDDEIYPDQVLVEFDLYLKKKDESNATKKLIDRLYRIGYKEVVNDRMNVTYVLSNKL